MALLKLLVLLTESYSIPKIVFQYPKNECDDKMEDNVEKNDS
jgi:hypothetical protein